MMNYKKILAGMLATTIITSTYGDFSACIKADDVTKDVYTNQSEDTHEYTYDVYVTEEGTLGENVKYSLDSSGVLRISGSGKMNNFESSPFETPEKIRVVFFDEAENCSVENIGDNTFNGCTNLYGIKIPLTVTEIGIHAFSKCTSLVEIVVPDTVTRIGEYAFENCSSMKKAVLGKGLKKVGTSSSEFFIFSGCYELEELHMPSLITGEDVYFTDSNGKNILDHSIGQVDSLFDNRCDFTNSYITTTMKEKYNLKKIIVTSGEEIYPYEFAGIGAEEIVLPDTITKISEYSFFECRYLSQIIIPDAVTYIGEKAFDECRSLSKLFLGKGITTIEDDAFAHLRLIDFDVYYNGTEKDWKKVYYRPFSDSICFTDSKEEYSDTEKTPSNPDQLKILEQGSLGEKIDYILYDNGNLRIGGTGLMDDYDKSPFVNKDKILNVSFDLTEKSSVESIGRN